MTAIVAWLAYFPAVGAPLNQPAYRFWSGTGTLEYLNEDWLGAGSLISVGAAETSINQPTRRMTIALSTAGDEVLRQQLMQDPGPLEIEVRWIYSEDQGLSWLLVPRLFKGRLSRPVIADGIYTIELETYAGDVDRGRPVKWSDSDQRRRDSTDNGMGYMTTLASGFERRWPP